METTAMVTVSYEEFNNLVEFNKKICDNPDNFISFGYHSLSVVSKDEAIRTVNDENKRLKNELTELTRMTNKEFEAWKRLHNGMYY